MMQIPLARVGDHVRKPPDSDARAAHDRSRNQRTLKANKMTVQPPERLLVDRLKTPIGIALLAVDEEDYLRAFDWLDYGDRQEKLLRRFAGGAPVATGAAPVAMRQAVAAYFEGELTALNRIAWRSRGTDFQQSCWQALCAIPAGSTSSYGAQALKIGRPGAMRAVGLANGCNPVGVVVPCHRVIGADGALTGYGGGLWRKRWLLRHEGAAFRDDAEGFDFSVDINRAFMAV
jgi:methylated-DNA-[protein]-cysteine S-methyltransferase